MQVLSAAHFIKFSCWCDLVCRYKCVECERPEPPKGLIHLKAYLRLIAQDIFNPENPQHREIIEKVIENNDGPSSLSREELAEIFGVENCTS